jgi:flagellar hook-length control protein FliK
MLAVGNQGIANGLLGQNAGTPRATSTGNRADRDTTSKQEADGASHNKSGDNGDAQAPSCGISAAAFTQAKAPTSVADAKSSKKAEGEKEPAVDESQLRVADSQVFGVVPAETAPSFANVLEQAGQAAVAGQMSFVPSAEVEGQPMAGIATATLPPVMGTAEVAPKVEVGRQSQAEPSVLTQVPAVPAFRAEGVVADVAPTLTAGRSGRPSAEEAFLRTAPSEASEALPFQAAVAAARAMTKAAVTQKPQVAGVAVPTVQPTGVAEPTLRSAVAVVPTVRLTVAAEPAVPPAVVAVPVVPAVAVAEPAVRPTVATLSAVRPAVVAVPTDREPYGGGLMGDGRSAGRNLNAALAGASKTRLNDVSSAGTQEGTAVAAGSDAAYSVFAFSAGQDQAQAAAVIGTSVKADAPNDVASASAPTTPAETLRQAAETPVSDQIAQSLRGLNLRADRQLVVRLSPPDLGDVRVTLRTSGNQIQGVLEAENPETFRRLEREASSLVSRLQDSGFQVQRLDVTLSRQDSGSTSENPMASWDGGRGASQDGAGRHDAQTAPSEGRAAAETVASERTWETADIGSSSINVRV